eukprot:TRINITY_DN1085_c0_g4_i1.p1 TRINITY_DN1085_c0_g4~~TRINITY_DN1085_c0_g4_i1.p1  ORF type:complete len:264 (-),score=71.44 TRINITY_DN1085_c0_g4_i1:380-1171(-)
MRGGQAFILWAYILFTWYVVTWRIVLPRYDEAPGYAQVYLAIVHILFALVAGSFYKAYSTDPGRVPDNLKLEAEEMLERKKKGVVRSCKLCTGSKPDRTHHCKKCNRCVLKMDHHCPWTLNCIGFRNYRYFVLIIMWASASISFALLTNLGTTYDAWNAPNKQADEYLILTSFVLSCFQLFNVLPLFMFHLWLISKNMTTLEFLEKYQQAIDKPYENPFNVGFVQNWTQVFGPNPLLWFLPVSVNAPGDGVHFGTADPDERSV